MTSGGGRIMEWKTGRWECVEGKKATRGGGAKNEQKEGAERGKWGEEEERVRTL